MFARITSSMKKSQEEIPAQGPRDTAEAREEVLVIHPLDPTTDFLCPVYAGLPRTRLIGRGPAGLKDLRQGLPAGRRLLGLGHGSPSGLFKIGPDGYGFWLDDEWADALRHNGEHVYIWCYAGSFVERHRLGGFYTGMFISEVQEAEFLGLRGITQKMVDESNETFSRVVGHHIHLKKEEIYAAVAREYAPLAHTNRVVKYNFERIGVR